MVGGHEILVSAPVPLGLFGSFNLLGLSWDMAWRVVGLTIKGLDPGLNNLGLPKIVFDNANKLWVLGLLGTKIQRLLFE